MRDKLIGCWKRLPEPWRRTGHLGVQGLQRALTGPRVALRWRRGRPAQGAVHVAGLFGSASGVGQSARLFSRARQVAPCVIFIDELDSLVPARGGGMGEPQVTERVVNTILAEMDGLEELQSVVVIGATNRPNLVDPALLRPGRFDELIYVGVPDQAGRRRILGIQTAKMPLAADVDLDRVAARTERFTGADLEDVVRRAGLVTLRRSLESKEVDMAAFETALGESRASVTAEVERDYEQMASRLKQDALSVQPLGFISPGQLTPRGPKGAD